MPLRKSICGSKDIQIKVVTLIVLSILGIVVLPLSVVHRNPHFRRIPVVQAIAAAKVFLSPEVLGIVDVRIVIKPIPVAEIGLSTPSAAIGPLVSRSIVGQSDVTA